MDLRRSRHCESSCGVCPQLGQVIFDEQMEFLKPSHAAEELQCDAHSVNATLVVVFVEQRQVSDGSESLGLQIECESLQVGRVGEHKIVVVEDFCRLVVCLVVGGEYRERRLWHRDVILVAATKVRELVGDGRRLLGGRIEDTVK